MSTGVSWADLNDLYKPIYNDFPPPKPDYSKPVEIPVKPVILKKLPIKTDNMALGNYIIKKDIYEVIMCITTPCPQGRLLFKKRNNSKYN